MKKIRQNSFLYLLVLLPVIFLAFNPVNAEIVIDGELNETEWQKQSKILL